MAFTKTFKIKVTLNLRHYDYVKDGEEVILAEDESAPVGRTPIRGGRRGR
ncbi:MAG: hypothetical protein HQL32_13550 [Planctomycetes bacterium]|nr:hypothetical protein [Planctomycetota bacterium]